MSCGMPLAHQTIKRLRGNMELAMQAIPGSKTESKSSDPLMMIGSISGKVKKENSPSGKQDDEINALVPFLQLLNRQMSQQEKSSADVVFNSNGGEDVPENGLLLLPDGIAVKELQQALAGAGDELTSQQSPAGQKIYFPDFPVNDAKEKLMSGNREDGSNFQSEVLTGFLNAELKSEDIAERGKQKIIKGKTIALHQPGGLVAGKTSDNIFWAEESAQNSGTEIKEKALKNITGIMSGEKKISENNIKIEPENEALVSEIKSNAQTKDTKTALLSADEKILHFEKVAGDTQYSEVDTGRITIHLAKGKEDNKVKESIVPDLQPSASGKEDNTEYNTSHISMRELKESMVSKDHLRSVQKQYSDTVLANAGDKAGMETMQPVMAEAAGRSKTEQRVKSAAEETGHAEPTLASASALPGSMESTGKMKNVSPSEIIRQVAGELKENGINEGGRVKVILNPPSLGTLEMDVTVRGGKVEIVLVADNQDVQQTLNNHIDQLKVALQTQELTVERCDVFMQDKRDQYQQGFSQHAFAGQSGSGKDNNKHQGENSGEPGDGAVISPHHKSNAGVVMVTDNISLFA